MLLDDDDSLISSSGFLSNDGGLDQVEKTCSNAMISRGVSKAVLAAQAVSLIIQSPARTQLDSAEVVLHCTISPVG